MQSTESVLLEQAVDAFRKYVRSPETRPISASFAPGRVNLMGEHSDYNQGFALTFGLEFGTMVLGVKSAKGSSSRVYSTYNNDFFDFDLGDTTLESSGWQSYVINVVREFFSASKLPLDFAFDAVVVSNIPIASGLGSSSSLEVAIFTFLEALTGHSIEKKQKALSCQEVEKHIGAPGGIADQLTACFAKRGSLMLIDCKSHNVSYIPAQTPGYTLLLSDTTVTRELRGTAYPSRVAECQECLAGIRAHAGAGAAVESLRDAPPTAVEDAHRAGRVGEAALKRARHAQSESERAVRLGELLRSGDLPAAGRLLYESHKSRRDDMEVRQREGGKGGGGRGTARGRPVLARRGKRIRGGALLVCRGSETGGSPCAGAVPPPPGRTQAARHDTTAAHPHTPTLARHALRVDRRTRARRSECDPFRLWATCGSPPRLLSPLSSFSLLPSPPSLLRPIRVRGAMLCRRCLALPVRGKARYMRKGVTPDGSAHGARSLSAHGRGAMGGRHGGRGVGARTVAVRAEREREREREREGGRERQRETERDRETER